MKEIIKLNPQKSVVIVTDVQHDFVSTDGFGAKIWDHDVSHLNQIVEHIKKFIEKAEELGIDVVYTKTVYDPDKMPAGLKSKLGPFVGKYLAPKTQGIEFYKLNPKKDKIFLKYGFSAFTNKNLLKYFKNKNIENIIIIGFNTNICVESTARSAVDYGFNTYIVKNLVGTPTFSENHGRNSLLTFDLIFGNVMDSNQIINLFGDAKNGE